MCWFATDVGQADDKSFNQSAEGVLVPLMNLALTSTTLRLRLLRITNIGLFADNGCDVVDRFRLVATAIAAAEYLMLTSKLDSSGAPVDGVAKADLP